MSVRMHFEKVPPGDVPAPVAAKHLGLSIEEFTDRLPALLQRGFPPADPTTGNYDLDAIAAWRRARHPQLFGQPSLTLSQTPRNANELVAARLRARGG